VKRVPIRPALVLLALLVGVWLAFGLRNLRLQDDADAVLARARTGPVPPAEANAALSDYTKAGRFSPDQTPLIHRAELLEAIGRHAEAHDAASRATEVEPDNLEAWFLRWVVAEPNSLEKTVAKKRVLELNPWFAYALQRAQAAQAEAESQARSH
jgi:tetratricopeptide (TPR) repeat protein